MAADAIGARSPLTNDAAVPTFALVRIGCDPRELESLARRCRGLADQLRRSRHHLTALRAVRCSGRVADRRRVECDELAVRLGGVAATVDHLARRLERHAGEQRRVSLAAPATAVLRADTSGDGEWVTRTGGPHAPFVVVLVPGVGTTAHDRVQLDDTARRVWEALAVGAERRGDAQDSVSVISWLGYDPPDHLVAGLARSPALHGGRRLASDVAAWRQDGARRVVVVGHSYGALVAAQASTAGMGADEVVMLGAPGLGVADRAALRLAPGAELWSAAARTDPISALARTGLVHGPDPATLARPLPTTGPGHSGYLRDPVLLDALAELALHDLPSAGTVAAPAT